MLTTKTIIATKLQNSPIVYNDLVFYKRYSEYTLKSITKKKFQKFIKYLLKKEKIPENKIDLICIRVFPVKNIKGQWLIGKCNKKGEIKIFPKNRNLCLKIAFKFGTKILLSYIKNRGMAALIHEVLHLKYADDEKKVRKLTKKYFKKYNKDSIPYLVDKFLFIN